MSDGTPFSCVVQYVVPVLCGACAKRQYKFRDKQQSGQYVIKSFAATEITYYVHNYLLRVIGACDAYID